MTHLIMDQQPARSGRRAGLAALIAVAALAGFGIAGWKFWVRSPTQPKPDPAPEQAGSGTVSVETNAPPAPEGTPTNQPADAATIPEAVQLFSGAKALRAETKLQAAREKARQALDLATDEASRREVEEFIGQLGMEMLFSPAPMPEKADYTVQPGDSLDRIARRFGTTVELVMKGNGLRGTVIRPGDRLRVFAGKWSIRVSKTRNDLILLLDDQFFKRYRVGSGAYAKTPTGEFKITDRIAQPTWWHPDGRTIAYGDPENLLGTHWLALDIKGYGLHGTWEPDTIGRQSSMGCIRLLNTDIEDLFTLATVGTPVVIEE